MPRVKAIAEDRPLTEREVMHLSILIGLFSSAIVVANVLAAVKLSVWRIHGWKIIFPAGAIAYAVTYPVTDILDEVYGEKRALYAVWAGIGAYFASLVLLWGGYLLPPLQAGMQSVTKQIAMMNSRIVIAGLLAYLVSQHHDVWAFLKWKEVTGGKWLWVRNNGSTMISQLIDSTVFITVAFAGVVPWHIVAQMILGQWLIKVIVAAFDTPFVYLGSIYYGKIAREEAQKLAQATRGNLPVM